MEWKHLKSDHSLMMYHARRSVHQQHKLLLINTKTGKARELEGSDEGEEAEETKEKEEKEEESNEKEEKG